MISFIFPETLLTNLFFLVVTAVVVVVCLIPLFFLLSIDSATCFSFTILWATGLFF